MLSFGIKTAPMHAGYDEIRRVWREADDLPEIEHVWLWDHLLPLAGPRRGGLRELDPARRPGRADRAAQAGSAGHQQPAPPAGGAREDRGDRRHRRPRPPRHGSRRRRHPPADPQPGRRRIRRLRPHAGLPGRGHRPPRRDLHDPASLVDRRDRRIRRAVHGLGEGLLRAEAGGPDEIIRSVRTQVSYADSDATIDTVRRLAAIGFTHIVLNLPRPYPRMRWLAERVIQRV